MFIGLRVSQKRIIKRIINIIEVAMPHLPLKFNTSDIVARYTINKQGKMTVSLAAKNLATMAKPSQRLIAKAASFKTSNLAETSRITSVSREFLLPLSEALSRRRAERSWTWATGLQGALSLLPIYRRVAHGIALRHDTVWEQTIKAAKRRAREEKPRSPEAIPLPRLIREAASCREEDC
jgi:hypothetical protein